MTQPPESIYYYLMAQSKKLEIAYRAVRTVVFLIPAIAVAAGIYLILFPVEDFSYLSDEPNLSKFEPEKNVNEKKISFGVFPIQKNRYVNLDATLKRTGNQSCFKEKPEVFVRKTYRAFLFPEGDPITSQEELRDLIFFENKTKYPSGSLLHLKPTNEVFFISNGKKILFPGPEIFRAFGYSFDNLVDVEKSALDQFPDADKKVFLWTQPHPDGAIFQGFPSHNLYLIQDGEKRRIENADFLKEIWPDFRAIAARDTEAQEPFLCEGKEGGLSSQKIECSFDSAVMPESIGRYYFFSISLPAECDVSDIDIGTAKISFIAEKSYATAKDSLRVIFASILNRYIYKQPI
ncbi:MAG: hypothetical protein QMD77_01355 [Patescibacteria group bacterium]|nr:hypothetical protein [Patescibacteria group bacterium]